MTSPQPVDQAGLPGAEDAVIAALEAALLEGALVAGTAIPLYLLLRMRGLGLDDRASKAAAKLALRDPVHIPRRLRNLRTATARTAAAEPAIRARYLLNAAKRITANLQLLGSDPHALVTSIRDERRYLGQHLDAARNRRGSARQVDRVAAGSPWLIWQTAGDGRVEPECRALSGVMFTVDQPPTVNGRPVYPGAVHPNCLLPGSVVTSPGLRATTTRWYEGEVVDLFTDSGNHLAVTPNHPVLTPQGWVAAGLLDEGSYVVSTGFAEALTRLVDPHDHQVPAVIEDVAGTFGKRRGVLATAVPVTAEDFHGDGLGSEVAVIRADRVLGDGVDVAQFEPRLVEQLGGEPLRFPVEPPRTRALLLKGVPLAADGIVGRLGIARVLLGRPPTHSDAVGLADRATFDASFAQDIAYSLAREPVHLRDLVLTGARQVGVADVAGREVGGRQNARHLAARDASSVDDVLVQQRAAILEGIAEPSSWDAVPLGRGIESAVASLIRLDRVREIRKRLAWSGHVFNLETSTGWYVSDSILTHNCRCRAVPFGATPIGAQRTVTAS